MSRSASPLAPALIWFRLDLRLADNPALAAALNEGRPLAFAFVLDDEAPGIWRRGGASRWWLHHSLQALSADIAKRGGQLLLRRGPAATAIPALARELGAAAVYWNRRYEPWAMERDAKIKSQLLGDGVSAHSFNASLLHEPWTVKPKGGGAYFKVYSPFWRAVRDNGPTPVLPPPPKKFAPHTGAAASDTLEQWRLTPTGPNWAAGFSSHWTPGEAGAHARLSGYLAQGAKGYTELRNRPDIDATSRLSPHLHFGEISPHAIWRAIDAARAAGKISDDDAEKFVAELGWREFSYHLLFHAPNLPHANWRDSFDAFPWRNDQAALTAWQRGQTGYPIVDAGMRQLWASGWMHNRVRMIAASFLIKHLLVDWRQGAAWFWDTLVDADLASNSASWQWVAGSGADAAPYFRIFNPVTQGEKFDPDGAYVRQWVPELARLDNRRIHQPWTATAMELSAAGVTLGVTYPQPIVEHSAARNRALAAFASLKSAASAQND